MPQTETQMRQLYTQLQAEERVEVEHEVKVGMKRWMATVAGVVIRKDRRRHGLHIRRNFDDHVWSDVLVLRREDGELTSVTIDEYTRLKRI